MDFPGVSCCPLCCWQVMDESEACSLPGGLASVKRQFESQEFSSSTSQSSVTQFHFEQRSVQVRTL